MAPSAESSRPIMASSNNGAAAAAAAAAKRTSTLSTTPTFNTSNSAHAEIRDIAVGLDRMENKALSSQRVALSEEKTDFLSKLALGAKLDRALKHRMSGQDAVMRPRVKSIVVSEKMSEKTIVAA